MAQVRLMQTAMHVSWKEGEIVTVQVTADEGDGMYTCETIETFSADLKEKHAAELLAKDVANQAVVDDLNLRLAAAGQPDSTA